MFIDLLIPLASSPTVLLSTGYLATVVGGLSCAFHRILSSFSSFETGYETWILVSYFELPVAS